MSKNRSNKSCYPSKYSPGGYVTAAQFIIENICEKKANTLNKTLPIQFWKLPDWANFFKSQLRKCHSLIKQYGEIPIIRALEDSKSKTTYSLHAPWLVPIIEKHSKLYAEEQKNLLNLKVQHERKEGEVRERTVHNDKLKNLMELDDE